MVHMKIERSEASKKGIFHSIKIFLKSLLGAPVPVMRVPLPEQYTRVTEKFDVVHRMVLQRATNY
jgi:hypothetical protein